MPTRHLAVVLAAVVGVPAVAGADERTHELLEAVLAELQRANARLAEIEDRLAEPTGGGGPATPGSAHDSGDPLLDAKLTRWEQNHAMSFAHDPNTPPPPARELAALGMPPADLSDEDAAEYVAAVLTFSAMYPHVRSNDDPQLHMLAALGPERLSLLLRQKGDWHADLAANQLARDLDPVALIGLLPDHPNLAQVAVDRDLADSHRDELIAAVVEIADEGNRLVHPHLRRLVTDLDDPDLNRSALAAVEEHGTHQIAEALREFRGLAGVDDDALYDLALRGWIRSPEHDQWGRMHLAPDAIGLGVKDALLWSTSVEQELKQHEPFTRIRLAWLDHIDADVDLADMPKWIDANADALSFDEDRGKWAVDGGSSEE